jgi:uncharacterized repeat protein (TIGR01451 family)
MTCTRLLTLILFLYSLPSYSQLFNGQRDTITTLNTYPGITYPIDIDNDGDDDIVFSSDTLLWYENLGNLIFAPPNIIDTKVNNFNIKIEDINNDAYNDILTINRADSTLSLYINLGNGNFSGQQILAKQGSWFYAHLTIVDLDNDGRKDILWTDEFDIIYIKNLGNTTFSTEKKIIANRLYRPAMYAKDLDNDGDNDIITAEANTVKLYKNIGIDSFSAPITLPNTINNIRSLYIEDLNNDGLNDILYGSNGAERGWYKNLGIDSFSTKKPFIHTGVQRTHQVYTSDLDRDGDIDFILTGSSAFTNRGGISWHENLGNDSFSIDKVISIQTMGYQSFRGYTTDLDNDGDDDILSVVSSTSSTSSIVWYENLHQGAVKGQCFHDINQNCQIDTAEQILSNRIFIINPGGYVAITDSNGVWSIDSLAAGTYTIQIDTSLNWIPSCSFTDTFTVLSPYTLTRIPPIGFIPTNSCSAPTVSIHTPFLRPGFSNQRVYVQACNKATATDIIDSAYIIITLDSALSVTASSFPYTHLGGQQYRVNLNSMYPNDCTNLWFDCTLSSNTPLGKSLCLQAELYPLDTCILDTTPNYYPINTINPCNSSYNNSHLIIKGECIGDSIQFTIYNRGDNMSCTTPVRTFTDGVFSALDSIQLLGGDSIVFTKYGQNGKTIRMEVYQHPLHLGNSFPNATIERCGNNISNWTPNLVNILPQDDYNPNVDISCVVVRGSYDPNDKRGFPLGTGSLNNILPNQDLEYVIRFQNTGTDTAFTVVIRDTLSSEFDIFSITPGVSSHNYQFRIYGNRILEWTFNNIMLPDSNVNEPESNGFVTFTIKQNSNLQNGLTLMNSAGIYFDFNAPIITNTSLHTINEIQPLVITSLFKTTYNNTFDINIYPNPTKSLIHLQLGNNQLSIITIFNTIGKVILNRSVSSNYSSINIENLPSGVYLIEIQQGAQKVVKKIIKK